MPLVCDPNRSKAVAVAALLLLLLASSAAAQDIDFLIGNKPKPFIEPAGFYAVIIPSGFDCEARVRHVQCKGNRGDAALMTIDVIDVPPSATADLAMLNQLDRFKDKPHFKKIAQGKTKVDGTPAVTVSFSYDYLNNVERQVGVQQLIMVRGGKLYLIHLETQLNHFSTYAKDMVQLYASFKPARLDASGNPILDDLRPEKLVDPNDPAKAFQGRY